MKNPLFKLILLIGMSVSLINCEKKPEEGKDTPLVFSDIQARRQMILAGDTTRIWATASGYQITYHWSVEKGDLLGSGSEVTYLATPCTVGDNTVVCKVMDGNGQEMTRQVVITVF